MNRTRSLCERALALVNALPERRYEPAHQRLLAVLRAEATATRPDEAPWARITQTILSAPWLVSMLVPGNHGVELAARAARAVNARSIDSSRANLVRDDIAWAESQTRPEGGLLETIMAGLERDLPEPPHSFELCGRYFCFKDLLCSTWVDPAWRPLHTEVYRLLGLQLQGWDRSYCAGFPYQGYGRVGVSGMKPTEERLRRSQLAMFLEPGMDVLDVGSNCGFVALEASRHVRHVDAVELNPYLNLVGEETARWLGTTNVSFITDDFVRYQPRRRYHVVLSLANHHTIDGNLVMGFEEYIAKLHGMLEPGGVLIFESHNVFGPGKGGAGDDGDLDAKFDIMERYFEVVRHKMVERFVQDADVDKLVVTLERRPRYEASAKRTLRLAEARTSYQYERKTVGDPIEKVAFIVHMADLVHHYQPIWKWMDPASFDIVLAGPPSERDATRRHAESAGHGWVDIDELFRGGGRYAYVVANHYIGFGPGGFIVEQVGDVRIRMMYALGKSKWNFAPWNAMFDAILVHGPRQARELDQFEDVLKIQVGYPRFDDFYNGAIDRDVVRARLGLDGSRPVVVWLPTWKELSSIDLWADAVAELMTTYDVVVKPHPLAWNGEPHSIERLRVAGLEHIVEGMFDSTELLSIADFALCDYGGPPFGAILTDRKLVLLDVPNAEQDSLSGKGSFDIEIRERLLHLDPSRSGELRGILEDSSVWEAQRTIRGALRTEFVAPFFGIAGRTAALALANMPVLRRGGLLRQGMDHEARERVYAHARTASVESFTSVGTSRHLLVGKRVVGWGTGSLYRDIQGAYGLPLDYLVDSDPSKHGKSIDGLTVMPPERLESESPDDVVVVIMSSYRGEISAWLSANGFAKGTSFI